MEIERKVELLGLVDGLVERLEQAPVPELHPATRRPGGREEVARGIPASCVGNLTAFLRLERDLGRFYRFVGRLEELDSLTAQNQRNPRAHHHVLQTEIERFHREQPSLTAEEWLYLLGWVQRRLPAKITQTGPARRPAVLGSVRTFPQPIAKARALTKPEVETWHLATVSYNPGGGGVITAVNADQRKAEAHQAEARKLIASLSDSSRERMVERKNRRPIKADVEVRRIGTSWRLTSINDKQ